MFSSQLKGIIKRIPYISNTLRWIRFIFKIKKYCRKYDIYLIDEYSQFFPLEINTIETEVSSEIVTLKYYPDYQQQIIKVNYPIVKIIELHGFSIIGNSNIVIDNNGNAIYNEAVGKNVNNNDPALQTGLNEFPTIGKSRYLIIRHNRKSTLDEGISLVNSDSKNYYHFTFEVLVKFWVLSKYNISSKVPLIVNRQYIDIPQFKQLLDTFNIIGHPIIPVDKLESIFVKRLYLIAPIKISNGIPQKWTDVSLKYPIFNFDALDFIREKVLEKIENRENGYPDRIFISRKNFKLRSYNEEEIEAVLKKKGFQTIYPESLPIWEQIQFFHNAKVIVAASGAALTNVLYCKRNTNIIVFINKILSMPFYSSIAYHFGCNMVYIAADKVENPKDYHSAIHINPNDLKSVLLDLGIS